MTSAPVTANRRLGCVVLLVLAAFAAVAAPTRGEPPRVLLIALDAVPLEVVSRLTAAETGADALFGGFQGPVPLISTFPSTTSLALGGILEAVGLERSPGYEHRFFDLEQNTKRGGGPISYHRLMFPWRKFFDWETGGTVTKAFKFFYLDKAGREAVDDLLAAFLASDEPTFHAYFDITDFIAHLRGPEGLEPFLRYLDHGLRQLRASHPELPLKVVLYSDHGLAGGRPLVNARGHVVRALRRHGFRPAGRIGDPGAVVFVPYGLVSSFVAFTAPGREAAVAEAIVDAEGVDFCVAADGDGYKVVAERGNARIRRRAGPEGDLYLYRPLTGDPFGFAELLADDAAAGGWRSDAWWLEATRATAYPDALYRAAASFDLVENPASVVCSSAAGYMYGASYTSVLSRLSVGKLRWTHGAMLRGDSLGFLMSDDPDWRPPAAARYDAALKPWRGDDVD